MKRLLSFVMLATLVVAPSAAQSQPTAMSLSMIGVGPHGYDFFIGTWTCNNPTPSAMAGPSTFTITVARSNASPALFVRTAGKNFDTSGYVAYSSKTKTWWGPTAYADGSYGLETSTATGKKTVWSGSYFSASGKTMQIKDTYDQLTLTKYTDLGEYKAGGAWKTLYLITCTKM